jgi:hypothetical protein
MAMFARSLSAIGLVVLLAGPASAQQATDLDPLTLGTAVAKAVLILLAVLIALSVAAKLSIVFGMVPRTPETRFQTLVHRTANFAGRLRPSRSISDRRRADRWPDDKRG